MTKQLEIATLGGGCFWCLEAVYQDIKGVESVVSGYAGGKVNNPSYKQICTGTTGHAEVVQITFDPTEISYADILYIFWRMHDPTTLNRQGADVGTQYRSTIMYHDEMQKTTAEQSVQQTAAFQLYPNPIVTEVVPLPTFYPAEGYHQNYYKSNRFQPYCMFVIDPKVNKLRQKFGERLKA